MTDRKHWRNQPFPWKLQPSRNEKNYGLIPIEILIRKVWFEIRSAHPIQISRLGVIHIWCHGKNWLFRPPPLCHVFSLGTSLKFKSASQIANPSPPKTVTSYEEDFEIFFSTFDFFSLLFSAWSIVVLITLISNFNYKNQEKIFLDKCIKHMWQHQIHAIEVKQNKLPLWSVFVRNVPKITIHNLKP